MMLTNQDREKDIYSKVLGVPASRPWVSVSIHGLRLRCECQEIAFQLFSFATTASHWYGGTGRLKRGIAAEMRVEQISAPSCFASFHRQEACRRSLHNCVQP